VTQHTTYIGPDKDEKYDLNSACMILITASVVAKRGLVFGICHALLTHSSLDSYHGDATVDFSLLCLSNQ
jgi:hypothetical protein